MYKLGYFSRGSLSYNRKRTKIHVVDDNNVPVCGHVLDGIFRLYSDRIVQSDLELLECAKCITWFKNNLETFPYEHRLNRTSIWD